MSLQVFLSHSWSDKKLATFKAVENKLRMDGCSVWVDKAKIEYGEKITPNLEKGILDADMVLVLWSRNSANSEACLHEIRFALENGKLVVPCKLTDYNPSELAALADHKYIDFSICADLGLLQLSQLITRLMNRDPVFQGHEGLQNQIAALNEVLIEIEDWQKRFAMGESGNAASADYISSLMEAGQKLVESSRSDGEDEKARLIQFMCKMKEIAHRYPSREDDPLKQAMMAEAIRDVDPHGESSTLQAFREMMPPAKKTASSAMEASSQTRPDLVPLDPLRAHIHQVRRQANSEAMLRSHLQDLLGRSGSADPLRIGHLITLVNQSIDAIPVILEGLSALAMQLGVSQYVSPLVERATNYFLSDQDILPDHHGVLGLLDDAYMVHSYLAQINLAYQSQTGVPLMMFDPSSSLQALAVVLGPGITRQIDEIVIAEVESITRQTYFQQLAQQRTTMPDIDRSSSRVGSWGGSWEDEMARMGAECGISINF